jgi:hypothetical protein
MRWHLLVLLWLVAAALVGCSDEPEVVGPPGPYGLSDVVEALEGAGIIVVNGGGTLAEGETGTAELSVDDPASGDTTTLAVTVHHDEEAATDSGDDYRYDNLTFPDLNESIQVD